MSAGLVVVVHGLWLGGWAMGPLVRRIRAEGFRATTFAYPSVLHNLSDNGARLSAYLARQDADAIHLVGHSMGGLLLLQTLHEHPDLRVRRLVMLGSPYAGSHCGRWLAQSGPGRAVVGRGIRQWLNQAPAPIPAGCEVGVLAGDLPVGLGRVIPGLTRPNDGTIALHETLVPGCRDRIVLPVSHSGMLVSAAVARQVAAFLCDGRFAHFAPEDTAAARPD